MRKIILYIATSLDGKIADINGSTDWLHQIPNPDHSDYGYERFIKSIDTTIMGNNTYQQILGFDVEFPYKSSANYVITRNKSLTKDENVQFISENIVDFIKNLKHASGKDIWCVGGSEINALLLDNGLIDEIQIFVMPVILGAGISLTSKVQKLKNLQLKGSIKHASGVMELNYIAANIQQIYE